MSDTEGIEVTGDKSGNLTTTATGFIWKIQLPAYILLRQAVLILDRLIPKPTQIQFVQSKPVIQIGETDYPDVTVHLTYDGFRLVSQDDLRHPESEHRSALIALAADIKNRRMVSACLGVSGFLVGAQKIYIPPWDLTNFSRSNLDFDTACMGFWSSMSIEGRPILEIYESNDKFPAAEKYSIGDMFGDETGVLKLYPISAPSVARMDRFGQLSYHFQDGRTHIWMNDDVVIKLTFFEILSEHEIEILKLGIPGLPKLIDHWTGINDETFIVMENCGNTLSQEFVFEALIPDEIRAQREQIKQTLQDHGLKHLDDHLQNYVVKNGRLTMIDAEVIVDIADLEAFENEVALRRKKSTQIPHHEYKYTRDYYALLTRANSLFPGDDNDSDESE
jgi:hypothetical protein